MTHIKQQQLRFLLRVCVPVNFITWWVQKWLLPLEKNFKNNILKFKRYFKNLSITILILSVWVTMR